MRTPWMVLAVLALPVACGTSDETPAPAPEPAAAPPAEEVIEARSLGGDALIRPPIESPTREEREAQLADAIAQRDANPDDADAWIWVGRREGYLGRYQDAVHTYTEAIARFPEDARLYRHRGHRFITLRELDRAVTDLQHAADLVRGQPDEVEPDGQPNAAGIPTSTLQSNIWYHLALAHYLKHDFEAALPAWLGALDVSKNDDMQVATRDWLYMTYRRLGQADEAARVLEPVHADMTILENTAYHRRLLMYRGEIPPDSLLDIQDADPIQIATYGYGVGNWYLYNGDRERAEEVFRRILEGPNWAAFGYIAAEAELAAGTTRR